MPDREKVIGLLQEAAEYFRECRKNASFASKAENHFWELQNAMNEAIDLLKNQSDWIPVKEKPPEKPGHYLTASDAPAGFPKLIRILMFVKDLHETDPCNFRGKHRPGWVDWDDEYGCYEYDAVTHWKPLPEPPEGE